MAQALILDPQDNVATAIEALRPGTVVALDRGGETIAVTVSEDIPYGHKFAVRDIGKGSDILKYGEVIGRASRTISAGAHVHVHNVESLRARAS